MSDILDDTTGYQTVEVPCQRQVGNGAFAGSLMDFQFSVSHPNVWSPAHSYFVLELELLGSGDPAAAARPLVSEMVALAENAPGNLFSNIYAYAGGQVLSSIVQGLPQANALHSRLSNTYAYNKGVGQAMAISGSFAQRVAAVSSTRAAGNDSKSGLCPVTGVSLPGLEKISKPCAAGHHHDATVQIDAGAKTTVTGVQTNFTNDIEGAVIVINGIPYNIVEVTSGTTLGIGPSEHANPLNVAPTTNWYIVSRDIARSLSGKNKVQVLWRPPLGVFNTDALMGPGNYRITLSPDANFRLAAVETTSPDAKTAVGAASNYTLKVHDVRLYTGIAQKAIPDGIQPPLHLMEYSVYSKTMQASSGQFSFTVPPSTEELFVMAQSASAGLDPVTPPSMFKAENDSDINLQSIQVSYGGQVKPSTRWKSEFFRTGTAGVPPPNEGPNTAFLQHLYYQGLLESERAHDQGGAESFDQWLQRGPVYCFRFDRDATARDTDVQVTIQYADSNGGAFQDTTKIFLIAKHRAVRQLTISNGQITQVIGIDS